MRRQLHGCQPSQVYQPKPLDLLIEADPFRRSEGPLAASSQMLRETTTNVPVDVSEGLAWIPKVEVVLPALQVPVQPLNQLRDRIAQLSLLINTIFASFLANGSVSWLYYADRMMEFPPGMLGVALGTILLPSLSKYYSSDATEPYNRLPEIG